MAAVEARTRERRPVEETMGANPGDMIGKTVKSVSWKDDWGNHPQLSLIFDDGTKATIKPEERIGVTLQLSFDEVTE